MALIKDILKLDLHDDIKSVIDVENQSDNEIQSEMESYIVTDKIGEYISKFTDKYISNIKETGVWISGFYGSGKSYFGKMLGYILSDKLINGTHARDRFIPRLSGIQNESFIENNIRQLSKVNSRVILFDVAKQSIESGGLSFTLFTNFLKTLGFRNDKFGYMEYDLFLDDKYAHLEEQSRILFDKEWKELKKSSKDIARALRRIYSTMDYSEKEYDDTLDTYSSRVNNFSPADLKTEIEKYVNRFSDETIVFIMDEVSEAVSQKKVNLLELEGISEALSSISKKVWTIAIAQEKLNDVINNANVNTSQLIKVTDRFKTKIHLESTDVDVIIKNRLLQKKEEYLESLGDYYNRNTGKINDGTNLNSSFPTKTESAELFGTYYPFHKYQFDLLQKFLFTSNALASTQVGARGMIITTFDILRKQLKDKELFKTTTAYNLCDEAQIAPPAPLINKYDNARKILESEGSKVAGDKLLKTIHFLTESLLAKSTIENITKSYIEDFDDFYGYKQDVEDALKILAENRLLLVSNNCYKITSDMESKMLDEMKTFQIDLSSKKRDFTNYLKKQSFVQTISNVTEDSGIYQFSILTDQGEELSQSKTKEKHLKVVVYSLFSIDIDRQDFIENLKMETHNAKGVVTLVPDISYFNRVNELLQVVRRYTYIEEKYSGERDSNTRGIIRDFTTIKEERSNELQRLIREAYLSGSLVYLFDESRLDKNSYKGTFGDVQKKVIQNMYTKRLKSRLSDNLITKPITEADKTKLCKLFSAEDYNFFDENGNFIGEHLMVVEQIKELIIAKYITGSELESKLAGPPCGYKYNTIAVTLAAMIRAGKVAIKYNGTDYFSHTDKAIKEIFSISTNFKKASFKAVTSSVSSKQKREVVKQLLDLEYNNHEQLDEKIDYNINDLELANAIKRMADYYISAINSQDKSNLNFKEHFNKVFKQKEVLQKQTHKTTDVNYIEKIELFIQFKEEYCQAVRTVVEAEKFIRENYEHAKALQRFLNDVENEFQKLSGRSEEITQQKRQFDELFQEDIIEHFAQLKEIAQRVKDQYYQRMSEAVEIMAPEYSSLLAETRRALKELKSSYPVDLNKEAIEKLETLLEFCAKRISKDVKLEYSIQCENSRYSLSDINNYIELLPNKKAELTLLSNSFIKEVKPKEIGGTKATRKVEFKVGDRKITVGRYRKLLKEQLQIVAGLGDEEEIEIDIRE